MSQQTMSQLASLASRPDPAADTLAHYQALPVAHHQLEEATYESEALGVDAIVGWAASLDPSPDVIHIDMRSPTRNSYLGGRGWATTLWRELRHQLPTLKFLHLTPLPSSVDQLLNSMRNNPVGKPKDAHVQVYPTTNLVHTPPNCDMVCLQDLSVGAPADHSFFPFSWHLANPRWWDDLGVAPFHPTIPPQVHVPDVTHPTFYSTTSLQWYRGASCAPPFISSEPPLRTEPLPDPPHGVTGSPDPAPDRVRPSQPPLNFVDGNGYIVLRGLVEARDCEVGWNKVMKAWGSGDEKVVAKNFELLFNAARSEEQAKDPELPRRWQSKSTLGSGVGGPLFKKFHPHLTESVPGVGDLHPMTPGSVIVASVGSGPQLPHTDVTTHPDVLPPSDRAVGDCHLSSFLCLSEDYQVAVQAGTALGEAGEARWDTIQLHRGDMLLMVATSRHHGLPAHPDSKDGLQGASFNLWTPDPRHKHHQANTTHLDAIPPKEALDVAGDLSSWDLPSVDQVLWVGKGAVARVGLWEGEAAQALFADAPQTLPAGPPTCPFHPTFISRSAPAADLAVIEVGPQCMLFFLGSVHQLEVVKGGDVDAESEIHFALSGIAPPGRPTTLWHLVNTVPAWRSPKCARTGAWSITCPCDCKVCLLVCLLCVFAKIGRNSHEIRTKFVQISYEFRTSFT